MIKMKPEKNKGGRPPKCSEDDKKHLFGSIFTASLMATNKHFSPKTFIHNYPNMHNKKALI